VFKNILEFSTVSFIRTAMPTVYHLCGREIHIVNISRSHFVVFDLYLNLITLFQNCKSSGGYCMY